MPTDFRERGREGERERNIDVREKHWSIASLKCPDQEQNPQPKYMPDWESNLWHLDAQDDSPTNQATLARAQPIFKPKNIMSLYIKCY